jgi:hypothetical protein
MLENTRFNTNTIVETHELFVANQEITPLNEKSVAFMWILHKYMNMKLSGPCGIACHLQEILLLAGPVKYEIYAQSRSEDQSYFLIPPPGAPPRKNRSLVSLTRERC